MILRPAGYPHIHFHWNEMSWKGRRARGHQGIPWQKSKCCVASVPRPPVSLYIFFFCLEVMYAASMALSATSKLKASLYLTSSPDFSLLLGQQLSWDLCWVLTYARPNLPAPCHGRFCCTDILPCILLAKSAFFLSHCLIFFFSSCWTAIIQQNRQNGLQTTVRCFIGTVWRLCPSMDPMLSNLRE